MTVVPPPAVALVMSGGGARAAYQVGVLRAIAQMLPGPARNPFPIVCGTSAGAINAAGLASHADRIDRAVSILDRVWGALSVEQVFRADLRGVLGSLLRCAAAVLRKGQPRDLPVSLLDCSPLSALLERTLDFERIRKTITAGDLTSLCITASSYSSGNSISFFQDDGTHAPWHRARRVGVPARIELPHVLASCALPFAFPNVRIGDEHFGDGCMRQLSPISPALHLGAQRVLIIGVGSASQESRSWSTGGWPSFAQIAGSVFDAIFLDTLDMDLERLQRINQTLARIGPSASHGQEGELRSIETLVIRPSCSVEEIAAEYARELPRGLRWLLRPLGVLEPGGARVLSYLLFEGAYCRHLMHLGAADAIEQRERILDFLGCRALTGARPSINLQ